MVYNFQVEELHTYAVGRNRLLVHNNVPCDLVTVEDMLAVSKNLKFAPGTPNVSLAKRPGGYILNDVDQHGRLSPGVNRAQGQLNVKADGLVQSHHPIQNAWAKKNIAKYDEDLAPAILLKSASGEAHAMISAMQRERRKLFGYATSIRSEFEVGYRQMIDAGVSVTDARRAISKSYKYFASLGAI